MRRSHLPLAAVVLLAALLATVARVQAGDRPPNIVLLIADDLGWPYAGFMGDPVVRTPNLDALASEGTTFVNTQSPSSVCEPALRSLLAGIHTEQWDAKRSALAATVTSPMPPRSEVRYYRTVPRELVRRGYLAWEGGKLWEGTYATAGFTHGLATALPPTLFDSIGDDFGRTGWSAGTALAPLQTFLDEAGNEPFFLWIAPMLPHVPYDAPAEFTTQYAGLGRDPQVAAYDANVSWLDALVGAVLAELDARGLRDDTLVLFLSDNGFNRQESIFGQAHGKGSLYELGFRQPLILRWPGHVPAGVRRADLVSTLDVAPTILDYAGADALEDGGGRSLRAALETGAPVARDRLVSHFQAANPASDGFWVRTPSWRYLTATDGREELYAIDVDPFEQSNVAALHPEFLPGFRTDIVDWQSRMAAGRPRLDVAGKIVDGSGTPLAGENLELSGRSATGTRIRLRVLTSARGDFLFDSVPVGSYALKSRRRSAGLAASNQPRGLPMPLPAGSLDQFLPLRAFQAIPARSAGDAMLHGTTRDGSGRPVGGATVTLRGGGVSVVVRSNPDGSYRAEWLPAGRYRVIATKGAPSRKAVAAVSVDAGDDRVLDFTLAS